MKTRIISLFCSIMLALPVAAQSWIWYPGDMDIWMGNKINNLRTERGSFYPAFWQAYSHEQTVEYVKTVELTEAEEVELCVDGHFGVKIDNTYLFGMPKRFTVPAGRHTLHIAAHNKMAPPALWLKGKTFVSDTTWTVTNYAVPAQVDTWKETDGTPTFTHPEQCPSSYRLPITPIQPVKSERTGKELFVEWQREGIGYLQLNGVSGDGQVNVYYGESPDEARDKQHSILTDQVVFSGDQVTDLATMVIQPRSGSIYALKNSRAMRYALGVFTLCWRMGQNITRIKTI
ncbi:MAG: hypothetical protein II386_03680 [Bacteroidaceae bacterium]|nr:hypothetical protein [Bacteroidaceae bacterium]